MTQNEVFTHGLIFNILIYYLVEDYISIAKEKYGYNSEQALGMLFWHKHDLEKALIDLSNFTPFPDEWSVEDKVLFEQAFQFHGKSFHRIRQMVNSCLYILYSLRVLTQQAVCVFLVARQIDCCISSVLLFLEKNSSAKQSNGPSSTSYGHTKTWGRIE